MLGCCGPGEQHSCLVRCQGQVDVIPAADGFQQWVVGQLGQGVDGDILHDGILAAFGGMGDHPYMEGPGVQVNMGGIGIGRAGTRGPVAPDPVPAHDTVLVHGG